MLTDINTRGGFRYNSQACDGSRLFAHDVHRIFVVFADKLLNFVAGDQFPDDMDLPWFAESSRVFDAHFDIEVPIIGPRATPTPVISRAILVYNRGRQNHFADGRHRRNAMDRKSGE